MSQARKSHRQPSNSPESPLPAKTAGGNAQRWVVLGLALLLAAGASWAVMEFVVWNTLPAELVGKWVVEGGEQDGATFDFFRNGRMRGRINVGGKTHWIDARVRVEEDKLLTTTRNPHTGMDETRAQKIGVLTGQALTLVDERGHELRLLRAD